MMTMMLIKKMVVLKHPFNLKIVITKISKMRIIDIIKLNIFSIEKTKENSQFSTQHTSIFF